MPEEALLISRIRFSLLLLSFVCSEILPTGKPGEIFPQIIISEGVKRIVDAKTTAPPTQTRDPKANDPKAIHQPKNPDSGQEPKPKPAPLKD